MLVSLCADTIYMRLTWEMICIRRDTGDEIPGTSMRDETSGISGCVLLLVLHVRYVFVVPRVSER